MKKTHTVGKTTTNHFLCEYGKGVFRLYFSFFIKETICGAKNQYINKVLYADVSGKI